MIRIYIYGSREPYNMLHVCCLLTDKLPALRCVSALAYANAGATRHAAAQTGFTFPSHAVCTNGQLSRQLFQALTPAPNFHAVCTQADAKLSREGQALKPAPNSHTSTKLSRCVRTG